MRPSIFFSLFSSWSFSIDRLDGRKTIPHPVLLTPLHQLSATNTGQFALVTRREATADAAGVKIVVVT